jgi:hypothetical protein
MADDKGHIVVFAIDCLIQLNILKVKDEFSSKDSIVSRLVLLSSNCNIALMVDKIAV